MRGHPNIIELKDVVRDPASKTTCIVTCCLILGIRPLVKYRFPFVDSRNDRYGGQILPVRTAEGKNKFNEGAGFLSLKGNHAQRCKATEHHRKP